MKVGVLDYGVGNLGSVMRALEELQATPLFISRAVDIHDADCLILPGVGHFADCARLLEDGGWSSALRDEVLGNNRPLLGVCVGMQLLATYSMEGVDESYPNGILGLDLVPGMVEHLRVMGCPLRVPHVGWNSIKCVAPIPSLLDGISDGTDFYFVHSYAFNAKNPSDVIATVDYGVEVAAAIQHANIWGTQFHPEKSSRAGLRILQNFIFKNLC